MPSQACRGRGWMSKLGVLPDLVHAPDRHAHAGTLIHLYTQEQAHAYMDTLHTYMHPHPPTHKCTHAHPYTPTCTFAHIHVHTHPQIHTCVQYSDLHPRTQMDAQTCYTCAQRNTGPPCAGYPKYEISDYRSESKNFFSFCNQPWPSRHINDAPQFLHPLMPRFESLRLCFPVSSSVPIITVTILNNRLALPTRASSR